MDLGNLTGSVPERSKVDKIIASHSCEKSALIAILQEIEELYGYLPAWTLKHVSEKLDVPLIQVYGVASFYDAFHLTPRGKHLIRVCLGTACHVRGGQKVIEELERKLNIKVGETTKDLKFTLERVNCLGCCALGPIVMIGEKYYGHMSPAKVAPLIKKTS
jgi:NADH-quinone oxidoreductase subunit E